MLAPNTEIQSTLKIGGDARRFPLLRKPVFWIVAVLVVAAAGLYWWSASGTSTTFTYATATARRGDLTITVSATGTVEPVNKVDVSSVISGTISEVLVDFNDVVTEGEVLARVNTDKLTAQTNSARADLEAARAAVTEAQATVTETDQALKRTGELADRGHATEQDRDTAKAAYDRALAALASAEAQVKVKEATLAANETDLSKAEIKSPINGVVLDREVNPGTTVAVSLSAPTLFTIAEDLRQMRVLVNVDEADAGTVKESQDATFTVEAFPERTFTAKVTQLRYASTTTNDVVTYTGVLSVDNSDLAIRPGMTATANIVVEHAKDALIIPNTALRYAPASSLAAGGATGGRGNWLQNLFRPPRSTRTTVDRSVPNGQKRVWVLREGEPQAVLITPGASDGTSTVVLSGGLAEGDTVVTDETQAK